MHALPTAPSSAPRRQVFIGTAIAAAAAAAALGGMLAQWWRFRAEALAEVGRWVPEDISIPMVPANVMLIACLPIGLFAQWAVYAAKRGDKQHAGVALALVGVLGLAFINAQAYIYATMKLPITEGDYGAMFYAVTGLMMALAIAGVVFSAVVAFRYLGGRTTDVEVVSAHALFWYVFSAAYAVLWFVVYVTK